MKVIWALSPDQSTLVYPMHSNVVMRNLSDPLKSVIYTDFLTKVSSVVYSPNGNYMSAGDEKGKLRVFSYNAESKEFIIKKEHNFLA
jgi:WD40 repeat protein